MTGSAKGDAQKHGKNVRQKAGVNRSVLASDWGEFTTQTPVAFKVSRDVIKLYHTQNREAGNRHPELA